MYFSSKISTYEDEKIRTILKAMDSFSIFLKNHISVATTYHDQWQEEGFELLIWK